MREAIKTGKLDAVVFTSSSTVRNLVGIAGKPHASTIIAVIGPATARTCEEHGLRVDVIAAKPSVVDLADSLAMGRAFLALYQATAERVWLTRAESAVQFIEARFRAPIGYANTMRTLRLRFPP